MDTAHVENHNEIGREFEPARYVLRHIFFALDEMSLEFLGGATMEFIWLEPGSSLSGGRRVMMTYYASKGRSSRCQAAGVIGWVNRE